MQERGTLFSGAQGQTLKEAAEAVPHGAIRMTTAENIRRTGGTVTVVPEHNPKTGLTNYRHVNIVEGRKTPSTFSEQTKNPIPPKERMTGPFMRGEKTE